MENPELNKSPENKMTIINRNANILYYVSCKKHTIKKAETCSALISKIRNVYSFTETPPFKILPCPNPTPRLIPIFSVKKIRVPNPTLAAIFNKLKSIDSVL